MSGKFIYTYIRLCDLHYKRTSGAVICLNFDIAQEYGGGGMRRLLSVE